MSTLPRARCAPQELIEVGMMMASDVPIYTERHPYLERDADEAEALVKDRNQYRAAADPEHTCQQTGKTAGGDEEDGDLNELCGR